MHQQDSPQGTPEKIQRKSLSTRWLAMIIFVVSIIAILLLVVLGTNVNGSLLAEHSSSPTVHQLKPTPRPTVLPTPTPVFDPSVGAVLPKHRVVAFYAVPGAEPTGPAYDPTPDMLNQLKQQGAAYEQLDPAHPVQLGIDLVVSVPDADPGPAGTYSHHVDPDTIQTYIDFCQQNNLVLFLDLNIGWAPVMDEINFFMPYLVKYSFVHMAIDPEWMFPRHNGIPGINISNVRSSDLNPIIEAVAALPMKYHIPRKMLIIHQYRGDGDGLPDPFDAGQAELADKQGLIFDPRVDLIIHVDSVGGFVGDHEDKMLQYSEWVKADMQKFSNFQYGGFKLFYHLEAKTGLMTPKDVLSMDPPPMVVTYGN